MSKTLFKTTKIDDDPVNQRVKYMNSTIIIDIDECIPLLSNADEVLIHSTKNCDSFIFLGMVTA